MKKISHLCMLLLLLCTTFFVFNINYTREAVRIREMGKTVDSLDLYLKDINELQRLFFDFLRMYQRSTRSPSSKQTVVMR